METFYNAFKIFFVFIIAKNIVGIFMGMKMARKKKKENLKSNIEDIKKEKKQEQKKVETVKGELCGTEVAKHEAYIVVKDGIRHYFCSWECRQKFISGKEQINHG